MIEFNELLKKAYKEGKVRNIDDAFNELPYEESINLFISESSVGYEEEYKVGDIVYVKKYFYNDGRKGNNHMFVIIGQENNDECIENFGMLISSDIDKLKYKENMLLKKDSLNNLQKNSIVKTDVIYKLSNENIVFKIGEVSKDKIEDYLNKLKVNN